MVLVVGGVASAGPTKPVRKPAPPELPADRLSYFVDAVIHDKQGDYDRAISSYRTAADGKQHAAIVYNIADLERRSEDFEEAIRDYKKYLELAPQAPDRAAVLQLIAQLEKTPASVVIDGEDLDGLVFIDGKRAGTSPLVTSLGDGWHTIDRIGPDSYLHDTINARPLMQKHVTSYSDSAKGNVILSTSSTYGGSWKDREVTYRLNQRFELPPGKYETYFVDPGRACSPLTFQVPRDGLVYVYVDAPDDKRKRDACIPIKVTVQNLPFRGSK
jgi:tetratricopeptide (TPR) repeat protein